MVEACGAGRIRRRVEQVQQVVRVGFGFGHDAEHVLTEARRIRDLTAGSAARHHEFAHEFWSAPRDLLGHDAAKGPAEQVDRRKAQRLDELDGAFGESLDGVARLAAGVSDPDVVEHDHVVVGGQVVQEFGIPPVDGPAEPVQQDQRNTSLPTEPPVGEGGGRTAH